MLEILDDIDRWRAEGQRVAIATVIKTVGSTPRPLGSKMAVSEQGSIAGSVSGGCIEGAVFEEAQGVLRDGEPRRVSFGISDEQAWEVGLSCGGTVEVLVEKLEDVEGLEGIERRLEEDA
ncbi:MAG TPA: XdhC family protein [Thermoanaerobaculia bacterium]|nr:XdhC family protein [Thermoanaerobaculia bacterium]